MKKIKILALFLSIFCFIQPSSAEKNPRQKKAEMLKIIRQMKANGTWQEPRKSTKSSPTIPPRNQRANLGSYNIKALEAELVKLKSSKGNDYADCVDYLVRSKVMYSGIIENSIERAKVTCDRELEYTLCLADVWGHIFEPNSITYCDGKFPRNDGEERYAPSSTGGRSRNAR